MKLTWKWEKWRENLPAKVTGYVMERKEKRKKGKGKKKKE